MLSTPVQARENVFPYAAAARPVWSRPTCMYCSASAKKGILQFSDENCFSEPNPNKTNEVKYEVYTEKREGI